VSGTFEVEDIFEISGRGAVLAGRTRDGMLRVGMRLVPPSMQVDSAPLVVAGVESLDDVAHGRSRTCLLFTTKPTRVDLAKIVAGASELLFSDGDA